MKKQHDDVKQDVPFDPPLQDLATRAYAHFAERGFVHGHDVDDWLEAERELRTSPKDTENKPSR